MQPYAIAVFDIGKTHKKILLFDQDYQLLTSRETQLEETSDEDGFPAEDTDRLSQWVKRSFHQIWESSPLPIYGVNVAAHGASWVHLNAQMEPATPFYSYFKPFPQALEQAFFAQYGPRQTLLSRSASPFLGNLNSGLQLYLLKKEKPEKFRSIRHALHLPQYISFLLSSHLGTEKTSIGCHTLLWDFAGDRYLDWVDKEGIDTLFPPLYPSDQAWSIQYAGKALQCGIGLHDSSAALVPFMESLSVPFALLSTGTWCISLNPFNDRPLTENELANDCLSYLSYQGKQVKSSRLLLGDEHNHHVKRLNEHFHQKEKAHQAVALDSDLLQKLLSQPYPHFSPTKITHVEGLKQQAGPSADLHAFEDFETAYHQLMLDLVAWQVYSLQWVIHDTAVQQVLVSGGFCQNDLYLHLLATHLAEIPVYEATLSRAAALGAAMLITPQGTGGEKPRPDLQLTQVMPLSGMLQQQIQGYALPIPTP